MLPIRTTEGLFIGEITYWSAVGASCKNPGLAYEFVSLFLTEDSQWELKTDVTYKESPTLVLDGWPVLIEGSTKNIWNIYKNQFRKTFQGGKEGANFRRERFFESKLTEADIPILGIEIDKVHFTTDFEKQMHNDLVNELTEEAPNMDAVADMFMEHLKWYVSEN